MDYDTYYKCVPQQDQKTTKPPLKFHPKGDATKSPSNGHKNCVPLLQILPKIPLKLIPQLLKDATRLSIG